MMSNSEHTQSSDGYEKRDTNIRAIVLTGIVSIVVIVIIVIALNSFFVTTRENVYQQQVLQPVSRDLIELTRVEDSVLTTFEMLDPTRRTYRVPIEYAMKLLVEESTGTSSPH